MNKTAKIRQLFFIGLFSSIVYIAVLILILRKTPIKEPNNLYTLTLGFSAAVLLYPVFLRLKGKLFDLKSYTISVFLLHIPLILGFLFAILDKNYIYLFMSFPVFLLGYIIIMPIGKVD